MSRKLTLLLGGARSGKSAYAQTLAASGDGSVLYVATATASDDEMKARIETHRQERPAHWQTLEAPLVVGEAIGRIAPPPDIVLIDCITLLANNVIVPLPEPIRPHTAEAALNAEIDLLLKAYRQRDAHWIVVSNEVGLGLVPPYPLGRVYRDALGKANQQLASAADEVLMMVAGLPLKVK